MKIYFETYGCTLNSGEGKKMMAVARASGHQVTASVTESDLVVLLTCTVIEPTELKMQKRIVELHNDGKKLVVAGCMAAVQDEGIMKSAPGAVLIPTPGQVDGFKKFLNVYRGGTVPLEDGSPPGGFINDVSTPVPIAEGCMGTCTYCITRLARGSLRSYPVEEILADIKNSISSGAREIRLTAQDTATYGMDFDNGLGLPGLLTRISDLGQSNAHFMVRVGMMNPNSVYPIIDDLIDSYRAPSIFKFLHLPVQSGSNKILGQMGRRYEVDLFIEIVNRFRNVFPDLTLSTDVIAGFPGEAEDDHKATMELLKKVSPNIVNITRYSERPGTPSVEMAGKLHGRITKARSRELTGLCQEISLEANTKMIGRKLPVLTTERDVAGYRKTTMGRTDAYRPVVIEEELDLGRTLTVEIEKVTESYMIGKAFK